MRKINADEYESFVLEFPGWKYYPTDLKVALKEWHNVQGKGVLYGIKKNGQRCILDTK